MSAGMEGSGGPTPKPSPGCAATRLWCATSAGNCALTAAASSGAARCESTRSNAVMSAAVSLEQLPSHGPSSSASAACWFERGRSAGGGLPLVQVRQRALPVGICPRALTMDRPTESHSRAHLACLGAGKAAHQPLQAREPRALDGAALCQQLSLGRQRCGYVLVRCAGVAAAEPEFLW